MTPWRNTLKLGDVFQNDALPFIERRDAIVSRIRAAQWYKRATRETAEDPWEIQDIVDDLGDAATANDFDEAWDRFYDWADGNRVWVETLAD